MTSGMREDSDAEEDEEEELSFQSPQQIHDSLVTLSLLPNSRWSNLLNLDVIKVMGLLFMLPGMYSQDPSENTFEAA